LTSLHAVKFEEEVKGNNHELFLARKKLENGMMLERMFLSLACEVWRKDEVMEKIKLYLFHNFIFVVELSYN